MNLRHRLIKAAGFLSVGAAALLVSLPSVATPAGGASSGNQDGSENYANPANPISPSSEADGMNNSSTGGSRDRMNGGAAIYEGNQGNPNSPADSAGNSPTSPQYGNPGVTGAEMESDNTPGQISRDAMQGGNTQMGPSAAPNETFPGASETPSGSPSVPGNSSVDDPNVNSGNSQRRIERDAVNPSQSGDMMNRAGSRTTGPSAVPSQTTPGASETPSGSPSVPGNSSVDNPNQGNR